MDFNKRTLTMAIREEMKEKRAALFNGLSDDDIRAMVPVNNAELYEYENSIRIIVKACVICGGTHFFGAANHHTPRQLTCELNGNVEADTVIPHLTQLHIDWNNLENARLGTQYGVVKGECI